MELNPDDDRLTHRMVLARHLKRLRKKAGLSLREFEAKIGHKYSYLSRVENCHQLPSIELAEALDKFFDTGGLFVDLLKADENAALPDYGLMLRKEQTGRSHPGDDQLGRSWSPANRGVRSRVDYDRVLVGYGSADRQVGVRPHASKAYVRAGSTAPLLGATG